MGGVVRLTPTSDERREVAARLRKTRGIMAFVDALGIDVDSDWCWTDVSRRVADLIDPTCHNASPQAWGTFECSECGAQTWYQSIETRPRFCPDCGARVVSGDAQ